MPEPLAPGWASFFTEGYEPLEAMLKSSKNVVGDHELFGGFGIHSYTLPWRQRTSSGGLTGGAYKDLQAYGPPINPLDLHQDATPTPYVGGDTATDTTYPPCDAGGAGGHRALAEETKLALASAFAAGKTQAWTEHLAFVGATFAVNLLIITLVTSNNIKLCFQSLGAKFRDVVADEPPVLLSDRFIHDAA